jgi:hypothetical protein
MDGAVDWFLRLGAAERWLITTLVWSLLVHGLTELILWLGWAGDRDAVSHRDQHGAQDLVA